MKEFNNLDEMEKYYDKKTNTYIFREDGIFLDIKLKFVLSIKSNIDARNIEARDIKAWNIDAYDIKAWDIDACDIKARNIEARDIDAWNIDAMNIEARDIKAWNIVYYAFCISYKDIYCKSITGIREKHFAKTFDGNIYTIQDEDI